ncbi:MAG: Fe-S protein assembly chaperone HscA [Magnetococcales bacterium]|nr:Fe-S protein assembly chaperone HscA [Magnetococcales bacterium]MBF0439395.1 Fe-S protein assembly chaperone HscA [Magnetococcales bacterium]
MDVLLDILEPGQSVLPHQVSPALRKRVVGIDLGTTFSLVAAIGVEGKPLCIPDEAGNVSLPSVVHYGQNGSPLVGQAARAKLLSDPETTISSVKRYMGRGLEDIYKKSPNTPHGLEAGEGGMVRIVMGDKRVSPVEVSAEILKALKQRAEDALGGTLHGVVITVPAYFDDAQRQATKDAARIAGLEVMRLLNEPTSAALAYGLDKGREGLYAIYDLGGGTFDISLLKLEKGVFQVMATGGDSALGGDDLDQWLVNRLILELGVEKPDSGLIQACRKVAREVKERLSNEETVEFSMPLSLAMGRITRDEFEGGIRELVWATIPLCRRVLKDAGIEKDALQGVVLVGGSTRVPLVRRMVAEFFCMEPLIDLDPDQVVALGAAHQAEALAGNERAEMLLLDVTPLSLGVETMGDLVEKIVPRNSPIPTARGQEFTTFKDGQTAMAIHVVQGERELASQCRSLARFELRGIPAMTAGAARILVTYQVDADGLLTVSAREETTGIEQSIAIKPSYGLSDDEIADMLQDAMRHGTTDMLARLLNEAKVDAERVLAAAGAALKEDGDLLSDGELKQVKAVMVALWDSMQGDSAEKINEAVVQMDNKTRFFAQRRMDRSLQMAMTGRKVDDFA